MIMGSEGRFGLVSEVKVRVTPIAESESFHVAFAPSWEASIELARRPRSRASSSPCCACPTASRPRLSSLAGKPDAIVRLERYLSLRGVGDEKSMVTFGLTGSRAQCASAKRQLKGLFRSLGVVNIGPRLGKLWEHSRFRSPYLRHTLWEIGYAVDTLETAVDWNKLPQAVDAIEASLRAAVPDMPVHVFTHMSHIYPQGASVYTTYIFPNAETYEETLGHWRVLKAAVSVAVVASGGTISHQHGVGRDHAPYLAAEKGPLGIEALEAMRAHFDPSATLPQPRCASRSESPVAARGGGLVVAGEALPWWSRATPAAISAWTGGKERAVGAMRGETSTPGACVMCRAAGWGRSPRLAWALSAAPLPSLSALCSPL